MKAQRILISCPQCGEHALLLWREIKRNSNLTLTCGKCGFVHLALNAIKLVIYSRLKKLGYAVGDPPVLDPIDPVQVFPSKDGMEIVYRRYKTTGPVLYSRRAKRPKQPRTPIKPKR